MMELVSNAKEMNKQIDELTKLCAVALVDQASFFTMNDNDAKAFKTMFALIENAKKFQLAQAEAIEEINEKLDKLLAK